MDDYPTSSNDTVEDPSSSEVERVTELSPEEFKKLMIKQRKKENEEVMGDSSQGKKTVQDEVVPLDNLAADTKCDR